MDNVQEFLIRGVANIIPDKITLEKILKSEKKLNVYLGIDPTAPRIHLGHAVPLRKLKALSELGHNVTLLIGDFTALVGDTSDKESERPILTTEEIEQNLQTYKKQAERILDFSKVKIRHNSEWLSKLSFAELIKIQQHFSLNAFISRELIKKRLEEGKHVRFDEMSYPMMQGYDSYFMDTDLQIGATDQTFNMQAGRTLQKQLRNKESFILTTEFLMGTDGRKMSKSWGNAIWLDDAPTDVYTKVMAITDALIIQYYTLGTNVSIDEIKQKEEALEKGENPMKIKKDLARKIVSELHSEEEAGKAAEYFEKTVQEKEIPSDIPLVSIDLSGSIADVLVATGLALSKSDAKRLVEQGGVEIDNERIQDPSLTFETLAKNDETIIQVGKRKFARIRKNNT
jgi:tyrosyl-tRNA synthetase